MDTSPPPDPDAQELNDSQRDQLREYVENPDWLDPTDFMDREQRSAASSRMGRLWGDVKAAVSRRLPERSSPVWRKIGESAARSGKRLIAREKVFGKNLLAAGGVALHEGYQFSKEVYHFIKEERTLAEKLEQSGKKDFQPFHLGAERDRLKALDKAHRELDKAWKEALKEASNGQWDHNPHDAEILTSASSKMRNLEKPSVPEAMSRAADSYTWRQAEVQRLGEAAEGSKAFTGKYLIGTAGEKYQYLLDTAIEKLGAKHFDRLNHPDRVLRFEQFAAERLYMDGYKIPEIRSAFAEKSPFITGTEQTGYLGTITERFDRPYPHSDLEKARHALAQWRVKEQLPDSYRHTPDEWQAARQPLARNAEALSWRKLEEAQQVLQDYRLHPEKTLTTTQEYQAELARIHERSAHLQNYDTRTSIKLMLAGHEPEAVETALNEASPFAHKAGYVQFQQGQYGSRTVKDAEAAMAHDPSIKQIDQVLGKMREDYQMPAQETRLDRLGLAHEQSHSSVQSSPQPQRSQNIEINPER